MGTGIVNIAVEHLARGAVQDCANDFQRGVRQPTAQAASGPAGGPAPTPSHEVLGTSR